MAHHLMDAVHAVEAAAVLRMLPARPRILALGEPTHGEDALLELRNELFRQLVEEGGYRTIAIESDCLLGLAVDDYLATGEGDPAAVLRNGLSHGFGESAANRELVRWMRACNEGRPVAERLRFAGFDGPLEITGAESPRRSLLALHAYLSARIGPGLLPCTEEALDRLLGPDARWTEPAAMREPERSFGGSAEAGRLRLLADDLAALLDAWAPRPAADAPPSEREEWERARLYGRTAVGLLRYHRWMADDSPHRMARLLGQRDQMMADNLLALAERSPTLVFAHNAHLQRARSSMRLGGLRPEWWSAGALAGARLGPEYAFLATAVGTIRHRGVDAPDPATLEGRLYRLPERQALLDTGRLAAALGDPPPAPRESPWFGYSGFDPAQLTATNGLVFVRDLPDGSRPRAH